MPGMTSGHACCLNRQACLRVLPARRAWMPTHPDARVIESSQLVDMEDVAGLLPRPAR